MELQKYHGLGNDYLVYNPQKNCMTLNKGRIRLICNRHYGFGSDGILYGPIFEENKINVNCNSKLQ